MSPDEYKATRQRLGMTQAALAVALDVSRKAINEREAGGTITREAAMALELLELRTTPKRRKASAAGSRIPSISRLFPSWGPIRNSAER
jgi:DNA-binding XRE family transcriptional regulator